MILKNKKQIGGNRYKGDKILRDRCTLPRSRIEESCEVIAQHTG